MNQPKRRGASKVVRRGAKVASQDGPLWRTYLRALGPGLVTGASDDDPSGIATYAQTGARFGLGHAVGGAPDLSLDGRGPGDL